LTYRWAVLAAGTAAQAAFSTVAFAIAVLAPALRDRYDLSLTEIGIVLSAEWIGLTFSLLPWGFAVDRFGERWTLAGGLTACSGFLVAAAYAPSFGWLVAFLGLGGIAGGSVQSGSGRAVMRWFTAGERGLALGIRQTAVPIGGGIAALVLPQLGSPKAGLLFVAGLVFAGALAGALVLRSGSEEHIEVSDVESTLRDRRLWLACFGSGLYLVAQMAMMGFVVLFLHDEHGFSTGEAAAVFAAGQVLAAALRIGVGRWSDVVGSRVGPLRVVGVAIAVSVGLVEWRPNETSGALDARAVAAVGRTSAAELESAGVAVAAAVGFGRERRTTREAGPRPDLESRLRERLTEAIAVARAQGQELAVAAVEVGDLGPVAQELGAEVADALRAHVAARIEDCLDEGSVVSRLDEDRYAIVLPRATAADAESTLAVLQAALEVRPRGLEAGSVTVSAGIAELTAADDAAALLERAGSALRRAHADGSSAVVVARPGS